MEGHEHVVLEEGIGPWTVVTRPRVKGGERVGRPGEQREKESAHREEHQQGPPDERVGQPVPEPPGHHHQVSDEYQNPQQDRPLQGRPEGGYGEQGGCPVAAVLGDVGHGEVPGNKRPFHNRHLADGRHGQHDDGGRRPGQQPGPARG